MLYALVEEVCSEIDRLDAAATLPALQHHILHSAPDTVEQVARERFFPEGMDELHGAVLLVAAATLAHIRSTARLAREMARLSRDESRPTPQRCALAGTLAYLVQPRDLIPDDHAGGYGFIDDAVLLRAGHVAYLDALPDPALSADQEREIVTGLIAVAPPQVRPQLLRAVAGISHTVQLLHGLDERLADALLLQIEGSPLHFTPTPPRGRAAPPPPAQRRWQEGAYFRGENIVIPGGPSLIDGELFIPSN